MKNWRESIRDWLLGFTLFTAALPTVVSYRGLCQRNYEWGLFGLQGRGAGGEWWLICMAAVFGWAAFVLNRRKPGKLAGALLAVWHGGLFLNVTWHALKHGANMTLRGDAMGVAINVAWAGPLLTGVCFVASAILLWREEAPPKWSRAITPAGRKVLLAGLGLTAAIMIFFFLGDGVQHTVFDRMAIGLVVAQCLTVAFGLSQKVEAKNVPA